MNTQIEQKFAAHKLSITSMEDYSDEIEFKYFNADKNKIVNARLIVDLYEMTPEEKIADFFKSIEAVNFKANSYTNAQKLLAMNPTLDIPEWDIITDEEVEFFRTFKREDKAFNPTKSQDKYSNWNTDTFCKQ